MTLTQAAVLTKRGILIFFLLIVLGISVKIGYGIWYQHYLATLPPVEEKPELKFGTLPDLKFPPTSVTSSNFAYSLDTSTGGLPQTPKMIKVYFIPQAGISLLSSEKAQKLAASLGFPNGPNVLSQSQYSFTDGQNGTFTVDITTGNFHFQQQIASVSAQPTLSSDKTDIVAAFKSYLSDKNLLPDDLTNGRSSATTSESSQSATVSLWPRSVDNLPIVTASSVKSLVSATLTNAPNGLNKFPQVDYTYWPIDKTTYSTYPLKTAETAFSDLRLGNGFVSLEPNSPQVSISSVYLAYYESEEYTPYLQPVFVFEGDHFLALVPAIEKSSN